MGTECDSVYLFHLQRDRWLREMSQWSQDMTQFPCSWLH